MMAEKRIEVEDASYFKKKRHLLSLSKFKLCVPSCPMGLSFHVIQ